MKVEDIASYFVSREAMDMQKLSCLVYLSYAWFYALNDKELFETEGFEASPIMPTEEVLFSKYHHFGKKKIKYMNGKSLNTEIEAFLESVYETYGIASSEALCGYLRMSQPYLKARKNNQKISRKDMKQFYASQQH